MPHHKKNVALEFLDGYILWLLGAKMELPGLEFTP
jgi:hypothetical protein